MTGSIAHRTLTQQCFRLGNLPSSVINLSKEISIIILSGLSILSQPKAQDEVVTSEKDGEETQVVNSEPFIGSLGGDGGGGGKDGGHESGGDGGDCLHDIGLLGRREGGLDNWGCDLDTRKEGGEEKQMLELVLWYFHDVSHDTSTTTGQQHEQQINRVFCIFQAFLCSGLTEAKVVNSLSQRFRKTNAADIGYLEPPLMQAQPKSHGRKLYTPDVEGTKAEADAKRARRAKIVFIILDFLGTQVMRVVGQGGGHGKQTSPKEGREDDLSSSTCV
jgi:hypothetical protein